MALTRITGTVIKDGGLQNADLPDSGVTANSYGSGTAIPVLTVNSKGIVTAVSETSVAGVSSLSWDSGTEILTLSTADGGSFTADISGMASESYVDTAINNLINSAPGTLDTLDELAAALGDDANFASTVTTSLSGKVDKINITGATVGDASTVPQITYNSQGQITSVTGVAVAGVSSVSYDQPTGVLTINTSDGGSHTTDIIVGQDDEPEFTNIFINDTGSTLRGIARTDAAYNLNLMGGADQTDGARIMINGGQRGGDGSVNNASLEFFTGSDYEASQSAVVGDYYFKTQWLGNSKTLMHIDSSNGYVGINTTGLPSATLDVVGNIAVSGTVDGRDLTADGTKLDGIESGATADQTKADIDALGINAATLDNLDSSQFLRGDTSDAMTGVLEITGTDARPLKLSRPGLTNTTIQFSSNTGDTYLGIFAEGELGICSNADVIGSGSRILTTADEGTGNGLDADTVDGIQAASFLRSDTADTTTGKLTVDAGSDGINVIYNTNDGSMDLLGFGVQFNRVSSYLRPETADTHTLFMGGSTSGSLEWLNITQRASNEIYLDTPNLRTDGNMKIKKNGDPYLRIVDMDSDGTAALQLLENTDALTFGYEHKYDGDNNKYHFRAFNSAVPLDVYYLNRSSPDINFYGSLIPADTTKNLGSSGSPWANIYTQDLLLSNELRPEGNCVDGTKGNWTIQEGEEHLYIINNKSGKKYRFALEEIE